MFTISSKCEGARYLVFIDDIYNWGWFAICWSNRVLSELIILLPKRLVAEHCIWDYQQLTHTTGGGNLMAFSCSSQPLIEPLNGRITLDSGHLCHVQTRANRTTASHFIIVQKFTKFAIVFFVQFSTSISVNFNIVKIYTNFFGYLLYNFIQC